MTLIFFLLFLFLKNFGLRYPNYSLTTSFCSVTGRGRHFRLLFEVSLCPKAGAELITGHHASIQPGPNEDLSDVSGSSVLSPAFRREKRNLLKHDFLQCGCFSCTCFCTNYIVCLGDAFGEMGWRHQKANILFHCLRNFRTLCLQSEFLGPRRKELYHLLVSHLFACSTVLQNNTGILLRQASPSLTCIPSQTFFPSPQWNTCCPPVSCTVWHNARQRKGIVPAELGGRGLKYLNC